MEPLYTLKGSKIQRYKDNVGKCIGGCIYVHRDYMKEIVPKDVLNHAYKCLNGWVWRDHDFKTVCYNLKDKSVRFDEAYFFNIEREPRLGNYIQVLADGEIRRGFSNSIWHHKWLWVKDDYKRFNVAKSYAWSKKWLGKLEEPASGSRQIWESQLKKVGLK